MIELYLSSDGKHTVKVSAQDREEMDKLSPYARRLYEGVLSQYGTKAQMWDTVMNGNGNGKRYHNGHANHNGANGATDQTVNGNAPLCPVHNVAMKYRNGKRGPFWSCSQKLPDGSWCAETKEASS